MGVDQRAEAGEQQGMRVALRLQGRGLQPGQRHQRLVDPVDGQARAQGAQQGEIGLAIAGIDHHADLVAEVDHHQVVLDAALRVQQQRVALLAERPVVEVDRQRGLERGAQGGRLAVARRDAQLAHVRDIEEPGLAAGVQVLGLQAGRVLDRHVPAGECAHARAQAAVQGVERNARRGGGGGIGHGVSSGSRAARRIGRAAGATQA